MAAKRGTDYAAHYTIAEIAAKASILYFHLGEYRKGLVLARGTDGLVRNKYIRMLVADAHFLNANGSDDIALDNHIKFHDLSDTIKKVSL